MSVLDSAASQHRKGTIDTLPLAHIARNSFDLVLVLLTREGQGAVEAHGLSHSAKPEQRGHGFKIWVHPLTNQVLLATCSSDRSKATLFSSSRKFCERIPSN